MVGSACFALGSRSRLRVARLCSGQDGVTFFVGSIFFTSAAYLQFLEVADTAPVPETGRTAFASRRGSRIGFDWFATAIQLVGTVFFNISTLRAMIGSLQPEQANLLSWRPDALGSVCFLASQLARVCRGGPRLALVAAARPRLDYRGPQPGRVDLLRTLRRSARTSSRRPASC